MAIEKLQIKEIKFIDSDGNPHSTSQTINYLSTESFSVEGVLNRALLPTDRPLQIKYHIYKNDSGNYKLVKTEVDSNFTGKITISNSLLKEHAGSTLAFSFGLYAPYSPDDFRDTYYNLQPSVLLLALEKETEKLAIKKLVFIDSDGNEHPTSETISYKANLSFYVRFEYNRKLLPNEKPQIKLNVYRSNPVNKDLYIAFDNVNVVNKNFTGIFTVEKGLQENLAGAGIAFSFGLVSPYVSGNLRDKDGKIRPSVLLIDLKSRDENTPKIQSAVWSIEEKIDFGQKKTERKTICSNDDGFLHIETRGMYGKLVNIELLLKLDASNLLLESMADVRISDNVVCVPLEMKGIHSKACKQNPGSEFEIIARITPQDPSIKQFESNAINLSKDGKSVESAKSSVSGTTKFVIGADATSQSQEDKKGQKLEAHLIRLKFATAHDICSDNIEFGEVHDFKYIWLLRDETDNNKANYYHWLKERNKSDYDSKPNPIPITLPCDCELEFKATFKIKTDKSVSLKIRAKDLRREDQYKFGTNDVDLYEGDNEYIVDFIGVSSYKDTIQNISNLRIQFEYSVDNGSTWQKVEEMGEVCLYLTWKEPEWKMLEGKLQINSPDSNPNPKRMLFVETLLWLSCSQAKGLKLENHNDEEEFEIAIADAIFKAFEPKSAGAVPRIMRAREGKRYCTPDLREIGLGYWRGASADPSKSDASRDDIKIFSEEHSVRYLLLEGVARCPEWTKFFLFLLNMQGIEAKNQLTFETGPLREKGSLYKRAKSFNGNLISEHFSASRYFSVKEAKLIFDEKTKKIIAQGKSVAQGNDNAQNYFRDHVFATFRGIFYDPSYGVSYRKEKENSKDILNVYFEENILSVSSENGKDVVYENTQNYVLFLLIYLENERPRISPDKYSWFKT